MIGTRIAHYEITAKLGEGGMGEVYRATDTKLNREVAIKVLPQEDPKPDGLRRFEQEARAASALNHPNIVTIYEIGEHEGAPFIAMEHVEGRTLTELLGGGALSLKRLLQIASQVADGLAKAHAAGIVHRDLKPDNIMVTDDGYVKILDFGLAKQIPLPEASSESATIGRESTAPGMILGTLGYMSPEQARGDTADFRSDQFSLGSILYEMTTGERPFQGDSAVQTLSAIIDSEPQGIQDLNPAAPTRLRWIVERCLAKKRNSRYESTSDLAQELGTLREHLAETTAGGRKPGIRAPRRPRAVRVGGILLALTLGSLATWFVVWNDEPGVASSSPHYLAVASFRNLVGDTESEYFAEGFTEAILTQLTELEGIYVVPADQEIGASLRLEGSIQKSDDRLRITYRLAGPEPTVPLGGEVVDGRPQDLFDLQDRVAQGVKRRLEEALNLETSAIASSKPTSDVDAYSFYLQGRGYLRRHDAVENADIAIRLFEQALARDPDFALAAAGMVEAFLAKYNDTKDPEWVERASEAGERARLLGDELSEVHSSLGSVYQAKGRSEEAAAAFERAVDLDGKNDDAYLGLAEAYEALGETQKAESTYWRAIELRPDYFAAWSRLGLFRYQHGRYEEAAEQFRRVIELTPDNYSAYSDLGAMYYLLGRFGEAESAFKQSIAIEPTGAAYTNLGTVYFFQGRYADSVPSFEKAAELDPQRHLPWGNLADAYRWAPGLAAKAPEAYRKAIARAESQLSVNPNRADVRATLATYCAKLGDHKKALAEIGQALQDSEVGYRVLVNAATVYELTGDRDAALQAINEALLAGYPIEEVRRDPELRDLRNDPRYGEFEAGQ